MTTIQARVFGVPALVTKTHRAAIVIPKQMDALTIQYGHLLNARIKANASGRPGPNAPTGDYRRSWVMIVEREDGGITVINGTNKPQARRLEFGFVGPDSLGRVYNQPPYPHVGPAVDVIVPQWVTASNRMVRAVLL